MDSQLILEGSCRGVLVVTNWRFAFFSRQLPKRIECPLTCVETITLSKKSPHTLSMCTRDLRKIRLVFPDEDICKSIKDFFTIFVSPEHVSYVRTIALCHSLFSLILLNQFLRFLHLPTEHAYLIAMINVILIMIQLT